MIYIAIEPWAFWMLIGMLAANVVVRLPVPSGWRKGGART